jgi:hypothetical protein
MIPITDIYDVAFLFIFCLKAKLLHCRWWDTQVVTKRNIYVSPIGELSNDHYVSLLPVRGFCFHKIALPKTSHSDGGSIGLLLFYQIWYKRRSLSQNVSSHWRQVILMIFAFKIPCQSYNGSYILFKGNRKAQAVRASSYQTHISDRRRPVALVFHGRTPFYVLYE